MADNLSLFICNSAGSAERERAHLAHLQEQRVQGILITPVDPESGTLAEIVKRGTPVVIVDRTRGAGAFCTVSVDDALGGRLAVDHLLELGHTRVAFIGGPSTLGQIQDRWAGAQAAWADAGLPPDDLVLLSTDELTVAAGREAGERLLGLPRRRRPTAAFCANDFTALGLLQQCSRAGRRVPGDFAIVGYDDIDFAAAAAVPLTSVRQPRQELGSTAARLVVDESMEHHLHEQVVFVPELIARESTLG
jgi:LacI family transcriptional regulator